MIKLGEAAGVIAAQSIGVAQAALDAGAVMYVMIRSPGPAMGPPLGVKRLDSPTFPLELTITYQDSMMAERQISSEAEIQVQARVSLTGSLSWTPRHPEVRQIPVGFSPGSHATMLPPTC